MENLLQDVRLPAVIITALVDSINPCAIGVLILLISTLISLMNDKKRMLMVGFIYVTAVYVTYFLAGLGLLTIIQKLDLAQFVGLIVGAIVIVMGLIELKDYWKGNGNFTFSINPKYTEKIKTMAQKATVPGVILMGIFVAAVELPCTGGPYLAITALLSKQFDWLAFVYLVIYNFIFILPLIVIVALAYLGMTTGRLKEWKDKNRKCMKLASGLLMLFLGIFLILFALDVISLQWGV